MKLIFLLLLSTSVLALKPHTATYTLSISGFEIADEQRALVNQQGLYHYTTHAQTSGLTRLVKDYQINAQSWFVQDEIGIRSKRYKYFERDGETIKKDINIMPKGRQIDPLGLFLALTQALEQNPEQTDFYFLVNNGKKIEKHHYQQVPNEDNNLIKIINSDKHIEAYFAKDKNYLPVSTNKKQFSYQLKAVIF